MFNRLFKEKRVLMKRVMFCPKCKNRLRCVEKYPNASYNEFRCESCGVFWLIYKKIKGDF